MENYKMIIMDMSDSSSLYDISSYNKEEIKLLKYFFSNKNNIKNKYKKLVMSKDIEISKLGLKLIDNEYR